MRAGGSRPAILAGRETPFARRTAKLRQALMDVVTDEDIKDIMAMLLFKAKSGDVAAAKVLLSYTVGKPGPAVDPDGLDRAEAQRWEDDMVSKQAVERILNDVPAEVVALMARYSVPCRAEEQRQHVAGVLRAQQTEMKEAAAKALVARDATGRSAGETVKSRNGCRLSTGRRAASGTRKNGPAGASLLARRLNETRRRAPIRNGTSGIKPRVNAEN
jgi:hypothetical protein